jgi:dedicator of cytokinesis protein 3
MEREMCGIEGELGFSESLGVSVNYRLYTRFVVPPKTLSDITPDLRSIPPYTPPKIETQVIIGIFPAAITHIRPGSVNDDGTLAAAFEDALREAEARYNTGAAANGLHQSGRLHGVTEEDEDATGEGSVKTPKPDSTEVVDVVSSPKKLPIPAGSMSRPNRPKSLLLDARVAPIHPTKPQPPVPTITAGDSTIAGQAWPLVDEIACAIREWHEVSSSL